MKACIHNAFGIFFFLICFTLSKSEVNKDLEKPEVGKRPSKEEILLQIQEQMKTEKKRGAFEEIKNEQLDSLEVKTPDAELAIEKVNIQEEKKVFDRIHLDKQVKVREKARAEQKALIKKRNEEEEQNNNEKKINGAMEEKQETHTQVIALNEKRLRPKKETKEQIKQTDEWIERMASTIEYVEKKVQQWQKMKKMEKSEMFQSLQVKNQKQKEKAELKSEKDVTSADGTVSGVLNAFELLIRKQREVLELSDELGDEGTNALMSDYIREQEKLVWMYSAFMNK